LGFAHAPGRQDQVNAVEEANPPEKVLSFGHIHHHQIAHSLAGESVFDLEKAGDDEVAIPPHQLKGEEIALIEAESPGRSIGYERRTCHGHEKTAIEPTGGTAPQKRAKRSFLKGVDSEDAKRPRKIVRVDPPSFHDRGKRPKSPLDP
jgi:hypothetical protein